METVQMKIIAHMRSDFPSKFGIPRQSGLVNTLHSTIIFEPEYRNADALRGLENFSHQDGLRPFVLQGWAVIVGWGSLPPVLLFGLTTLDYPVSPFWKSNTQKKTDQ